MSGDRSRLLGFQEERTLPLCCPLDLGAGSLKPRLLVCPHFLPPYLWFTGILMAPSSMYQSAPGTRCVSILPPTRPVASSTVTWKETADWRWPLHPSALRQGQLFPLCAFLRWPLAVGSATCSPDPSILAKSPRLSLSPVP